MLPKSPPPTNQMQHNDKAQLPQQEKEYTSDNNEARQRLCKSYQVQANAYKQGHPDATKEEIKAKYPSVVVPRKKTKREIEASQRHEGESEEHFAKHLQNTKQKQQQRVALKLQTPTPGPSRKDHSQSCPSFVPVPSSPLIDLVLLGPQSHPTSFCCIQVGLIPVPSSPPIDLALLAPKLPPTSPCILCDSAHWVFTLKLPPLPGIVLNNLKGANLLQKQANMVCRHAQEPLILEDTNKYIIFMHAPFPLDAELNNIIMDHLVHHQSIKLEGFCMPEVVKQLTAEYMATHWNVQLARVVEVHDTVCQIKTPIFPFKKMLHSEFIDGLADPRQSKKIFDVSMTHQGVPPLFGLIDDEYDAWNNTSSQYDWSHRLS
ncbi:hypothetical protein EDD18DRAFT_1351988 [Armillaria luteobubalina]|uniref:Uncharacterized protein n=1 Tax=Armillaria luteobubalina TaxID=153913 RepID=A0AA39UXJ1_9AGAR|nr:hypothetical protein EDD18DRAFT_1351988 [Armillaria luteobubalina]